MTNVRHWVACGIVLVVYGLPLAVMAIDGWLLYLFGNDATISRVTLDASRRYPTLIVTVPLVVGIAVGAILNHLFTAQQVNQ